MLLERYPRACRINKPLSFFPYIIRRGNLWKKCFQNVITSFEIKCFPETLSFTKSGELDFVRVKPQQSTTENEPGETNIY